MVPAPACVLTGVGLAEPALLYTWLPTHRHLQRHDPEGEMQGGPTAARLGRAGHHTPAGLLLALPGRHPLPQLIWA